MDYMSNKALVIAVSLIVTMMIASAVLYSVNQIINIYKQVYETDTSIKSAVDEFDEYDGTVKTKLDLLNTAKKYIDNGSVIVTTSNISAVVGDNNRKLDAAENNKVNTKNAIDALNRSLNVTEDEGRLSVGNLDEANKKYTTYVMKLSDGHVIVGFYIK